VEVVGPRFGPEVWKPAQAAAIPRRAVPGARYPAFLGRLPALLRAIEGDIVYASKPRPTSFGVGLLKRLVADRPLLLDIDDWELGFFYRSGAWGRLGRFLNLANPNGLPWTWVMERLVPLASGLTVASRFLEARFGGTLIPHVRDTALWAPDRFDRTAARTALGVRDQRVVMFLGTARAYKGVEDLLEAMRLLDRPEVVLALVGAGRQWARPPSVIATDPIPFDAVPRYLVAADVVAVPQRATSDTLGQVPAKIFDALALARPVVSTRVSMIPEILDGCGLLVPPGDPKALAGAIGRLLGDPALARALGDRGRVRCETLYSFAAARAKLFPLVEQAAAGRP
jgi:glycosyltransferase involved in cell wall biosynthesis